MPPTSYPPPLVASARPSAPARPLAPLAPARPLAPLAPARPLAPLALLALLVAPGCERDGVYGEQPFDAAVDAGPTGPDADVGPEPCNATGSWIAEEHTVALALGAEQRATTWTYHELVQDGDRFTSTRSLACGLVVDGTTTVTLDDATLSALAETESAGPGRGGVFRLSNDQTTCEFILDRMYNLRGAAKSTYLTDVWQVGDPPLPLSAFPPLPTAPPGMEDWDGDGMDGITLRSNIGNRYVAQRDFNQHSGRVPRWAAEFGGPGVIAVVWDSQEAVSLQTPPLLRVTGTPAGNGWARYARVDRAQIVVEEGPDPVLATCKNVQQRAQQIW